MVKFESPNIGVDRYKVSVTATAFVKGYPTTVELKIYGDNNVGKLIRLEVSPDPLGRAVYNFFKDKIFKDIKQVRSPITTNISMFSDWRMEPEEIEKVALRAKDKIGIKWEQVFKVEKKK